MKKWIRSLLTNLKEREFILFMGVFITLVVFRIWLISGIPLNIASSPHDTLFYAKAAHYIIHGQWMGPYNEMTLIKGPFYAIFMVFSFITGLPLLFNETIFYVIACIVMYFAIIPLIKNKWWRLLLFGILLFSPASLAIPENLRVYRGFVYFSLTLFVVAFSVGLFLRVGNKLVLLFFWACGLGLSMGAFMFTREEGIWIYPMLLLLLISCLANIWMRNIKHRWLRSIIVLCSIIIWYIPILTVSNMNYSKYGFWGYSETLEKDFNRVINNLGRIKTSVWYPYSSVTRESLEKAYEVSPLMADLKPAIDVGLDYWLIYSSGASLESPSWYIERYFNENAKQIGNGHFLWLFRDVLASKGYFSSGHYPREYLRALADQLQKACDNEILDCYPTINIPAINSIRAEHIPIIFRYFIEDIYLQLKSGEDRLAIDSFDFKSWQTESKDFMYFKEFVYNPMEPQGSEQAADYPLVNGKRDIRIVLLQFKATIMKSILSIYKYITLPFSIILCGGWFAWLIFSLLSRRGIHILQSQGLQVYLFIIGLLFSREMTLAITAAISNGSYATYGLSNYLFIYINLFLMLFYLTRQIGQVIDLVREKT